MAIETFDIDGILLERSVGYIKLVQLKDSKTGGFMLRVVENEQPCDIPQHEMDIQHLPDIIEPDSRIP